MLRALRNLLIVLAVLLVGGFAAFVEITTRAGPPSPLPDVDGVVALTGGGGARISAAMSLLESGTGRRMLVSGVNPSTTDEDIRRLAEGSDAMFDCCLDIGRAARTTEGNAVEIAEWAEAHGYGSLIIVTSDFHMPRSLIEIGRAAQGVELHPYPISRNGASGRPWWRDRGTARRVAIEYVKYLIIGGRHLLTGGGR